MEIVHIDDRDNDLHRLLFMPNGLPDGTELAYYGKGQVVTSICCLLLLICSILLHNLYFPILFDIFSVLLQRILGGYKQGKGIVCSCCDTEVNCWSDTYCISLSLQKKNVGTICGIIFFGEQISPSQFEAHAGWSARRQP